MRITDLSLTVTATALVAVFALTGCNEKSVDYYAANRQEALDVLLKCPKGLDMLKDKNCVNAKEGYAIAYRKAKILQGEADKAAIDKWMNTPTPKK